MDVVLNPLQGKLLIEKACVQISIPFNFGAGHESQGAETIIEADEDEALIRICSSMLKEANWVVAGSWCSSLGAESVSATMNLPQAQVRDECH